MSVFDLIGKPYRYGANGTDLDGAVDCIHAVLLALDAMGIPRPATKSSWYDGNRIAIARDLLEWGTRVNEASIDGDVVLLARDQYIFGVTWQDGLIHCNELRQQVAWYPIKMLQPVYIVRHCSRMNAC